MTEMKATGTDGVTTGNVVPIPAPRSQNGNQSSSDSAAIADLLRRLVEQIDAHEAPLSRAESKRRDGKVQHRFTCPHCNVAAAGVAYEGKKRVTLYCDRKCGATRMLSALGLDRQALNGRPDLMSSVPPHFRRVDVTNEVTTIHAVHDVIADGLLPRLFERSGGLVTVAEVTDTVKVVDVGEHELRALLSEHTFTFKANADGDVVRALPSPTTCSTILARYEWPGVDTLRGVAHTPALRPDGSVLQKPGYDSDTGLYLAAGLRIRPVPDRPDAEDVDRAKAALLEWLLVDFPWCSDADRANYLAVLLTGVLRPRLTCPTPLGVITAPDRGSGKSFLAETVEILFGGRQYAWPQDDAEMRKTITTMLRESTAPVLVFDNVPADRVIEYPSFAGLLTRGIWADRVLGQSREVEIPNDRLWLATGTNVRLGGDLGSRTFLIGIDPRQPRPDRRTDFKIRNYLPWVKENRGHIVRALLILARAWAVAGAPTTPHPMRGFTMWAEQVGGLLDFHGIPGFLANADQVDVHDEEAETWSTFLTAWYARYGDTGRRLKELIPDEELAERDLGERDWLDVFPRVGRRDTVPGTKTFGGMLRERKGRFYGEYAVRPTVNAKGLDLWKVVRHTAEVSPD